jgi:uncharacterized protein YneR
VIAIRLSPVRYQLTGQLEYFCRWAGCTHVCWLRPGYEVQTLAAIMLAGFQWACRIQLTDVVRWVGTSVEGEAKATDEHGPTSCMISMVCNGWTERHDLPGLMSHLVAVAQSPTRSREPSITWTPPWRVKQVLVRYDRISAPVYRFSIGLAEARPGRRAVRARARGVKSMVEYRVRQVWRSNGNDLVVDYCFLKDEGDRTFLTAFYMCSRSLSLVYHFPSHGQQSAGYQKGSSCN